MPRIPVIDQTTSASGPGPVFGRAALAGNELAQGLQNLGQGAENLVRGEQAVEQAHLVKLKQQEHADATVWAGNALSDAQVKWQDTLQKAKEKAPPGAQGFTPQVVDQFDAWAKDAIGKAPNEMAKRYLQQHLSSLRTSIAGNAMGFEASARQDFRVNQQAKSNDNVAVVAMSNPDPSAVKTLMAQQKAVIDAAQVEPEVRRRLHDDLDKKVLNAYGLGIIRQNPEQAKALLSAGLPVSPLDVAKGTAGQGAQGGQTSAGVDSVWSSLIRQESGGNQSAVSPKGAIGVAQIMPGTAPEAAALAGVPYDENRLKTDAAYNAQLGKAYLQKQVDTFGNMPQALAAYNAGPGAVQKAVQKAASTGGDWLSYLPSETQNYVKSIMGRSQASPVMLVDTTGGQGQPEPSGNSLVDAMPLDMRLNLLQHADSEMQRMQAVYRSQIGTTEADHLSAFMNGQVPPKLLTQQDYLRAYGPIEGQQRFANYQSVQVMGNDINALKLATPEQMQATAQKYLPDPAKPGFELANQRYAMVLKAIDQVNQARQTDPVLYAQQNKIAAAEPLNFGDPMAFAAQIAKRTGVAEAMQAQYGTPYQMLSQAEAKTLAAGFQTMSTDQKVQYLKVMNSQVTDPKAYRTIMQQIAPDSPVTAMAGVILGKQNPVVVSGWFSTSAYKPGDVAGMLLEGEALMNPTKATQGQDGKGREFPMPKDQEMRDQFNKVAGTAFMGDPNGANFAYQAVKAYYAAKAAREGDISGTLNSGRAEEAITAVLGGVTDVNGKGQVLRPWGMDESRFNNEAKAAFDKAIQANGYKGSMLDNWGAYGLQSAGDGKYLLRTGTGYLQGRDGQPVLLDLNGPRSLVDMIPDVYGNVNGLPSPHLPASVVQAPTAKPNTQHQRTR